MKKLVKTQTCLIYRPAVNVSIPVTEVVDEGACVVLMNKDTFMGNVYGDGGQELLAEFKELTK